MIAAALLTTAAAGCSRKLPEEAVKPTAVPITVPVETVTPEPAEILSDTGTAFTPSSTGGRAACFLVRARTLVVLFDFFRVKTPKFLT